MKFFYFFIGILILLIAGAAVTKLTIQDQVILGEAERECKRADYWMLYDHPIERLGIGWLGKTAVIEKTKPIKEAGFIVESEEKNVLLIKAYTLFRIPVGKSSVQCGGSSYKIPKTEAGIKQAIEQARYCEVKSDCAQVESKCPFNCWVFVNGKEAGRIKNFIDSYESRCIYKCVRLKGYDCIDNKCQALY